MNVLILVAFAIRPLLVLVSLPSIHKHTLELVLIVVINVQLLILVQPILKLISNVIWGNEIMCAMSVGKPLHAVMAYKSTFLVYMAI